MSRDEGRLTNNDVVSKMSFRLFEAVVLAGIFGFLSFYAQSAVQAEKLKALHESTQDRDQRQVEYIEKLTTKQNTIVDDLNEVKDSVGRLETGQKYIDRNLEELKILIRDAYGNRPAQ